MDLGVWLCYEHRPQVCVVHRENSCRDFIFVSYVITQSPTTHDTKLTEHHGGLLARLVNHHKEWDQQEQLEVAFKAPCPLHAAGHVGLEVGIYITVEEELGQESRRLCALVKHVFLHGVPDGLGRVEMWHQVDASEEGKVKCRSIPEESLQVDSWEVPESDRATLVYVVKSEES